MKKITKVHPDFLKVVAHILATYKLKKGYPYPFTGVSGKIVKDCIRIYGTSLTLALWDVFLETNKPWRDKDGFLINPSFEMTVWRIRWTIIIDNPRIKELVNQYEGSISPKTLEILPEVKGFPKKEDSQMNKVKAIKSIGDF